MALFDKNQEIFRSKLKDILKKTDVNLGNQKSLNPRQRVHIEEDVFSKKYGDSISEGEYSKAVNDLKRLKMQESDFMKKTKIGKEIKYLEGLRKKDIK